MNQSKVVEVIGIAENLQKLRKDKNYTQAQCAKKVGVSLGSVRNYENGASFPTADVIQSYCNVFGVSPNYIFGVKQDSLLLQYIDSAIEILSKIKKALQ